MNLNPITAFLMGLVQGVTEFLPVSSSGHLVIFSQIFKIQDPTQTDTLLDVLLHLGTLIAVIIAFWKDILELAKEFFSLLLDVLRGRFSLKLMSPYRRFLLMILLATLPLFVILPFRNTIESLFSSLSFVGGALIFTSILLWISDKVVRGGKNMAETTVKNALTVGLFQMVAVAPGISRSGSTITAGLLSGFTREYAIKFSFIMSLPAVAGASILKISEAVHAAKGLELVPYGIGIVTAAVSGYFAIRLLTYILKTDKFKYFSIYCAAVGILVLIYQFVF